MKYCCTIYAANRKHRIFLILMFVYVFYNLITLTKYPRVQDDEGLLSSTAQLLSNNGIPIIDLKLSGKGAFKGFKVFPLSGILFYSSLAWLGDLFNYSLYSLRLQPLLFSTISLIIVYKISLLLFLNDKMKAVLGVFIMAASAQYIMLSHTIRQEAMFLANMLAVIFFMLKSIESGRLFYLAISSVLAGLAVSIHPNGILMPVLLCALLLFNIGKWSGSKWTMFLWTLIFVCIGLSIYVAFDYYPYREEYWRFLRSPFFDKLTNPYSRGNIMALADNLTRHIWSSFWGVRYHRYVIYFIINMTAIIGGLFLRNESHKFLLFVILLIYLMLIPLHTSYYYMMYFIPPASLLFASVCIDIARRIQEGLKSQLTLRILKAFAVIMIGIYTILPIMTAWCYKDYDHRYVGNKIKQQLPRERNILCSSRYFFEIDDDEYRRRMYSIYLLANYDVLKLMRELRSEYLILERWAASIIHSYNGTLNGGTNVSDLMASCETLDVYHEYRAKLMNSDYDGQGVYLLKCPLPDNV